MPKTDTGTPDTAAATTTGLGAEQTSAPAAVTVSRAVKIAGEGIAPGASLILDGNVSLGILHLIGGGIARGFLGPLGGFLVAANSYTRSVTGKNLPDVIQKG